MLGGFGRIEKTKGGFPPVVFSTVYCSVANAIVQGTVTPSNRVRVPVKLLSKTSVLPAIALEISTTVVALCTFSANARPSSLRNSETFESSMRSWLAWSLPTGSQVKSPLILAVILSTWTDFGFEEPIVSVKYANLGFSGISSLVPKASPGRNCLLVLKVDNVVTSTLDAPAFSTWSSKAAICFSVNIIAIKRC